MNWAHLTAFLWLRYRLMINHWRRAGALSAALMIIVTVSMVTTVIPIFFGAFALAVYAIPKAEPAYLMYAWDILIFFFLLFWGVGLLVELQRNDPLSLAKFMHLPVSVNGAFLINYVSSLARLSLVFFGPPMLAFALALVYVKGLSQWATLPLLAAFFLMITAPTYQFQGWLASLMSNPRRRRAVVVGMTMAFVLCFQTPNLVHLYTPKLMERQAARTKAQTEERNKLQKSFEAKEFDAEEWHRRQEALAVRFKAQNERATREEVALWEGWARLGNLVVPFGWLPIGVMTAAEGRAWPSLLGLAGMTSIGALSLWRAYRTTVEQFQGRASSRPLGSPTRRVPEAREAGAPVKGSMLDARLPGLSEPVSAIALGGFRSLLRSPEAKIALLMPLIFGGIFGSILIRGRHDLAEPLRAMYGIAAIAFVLFSLLQMMGNQFGMDRDGFRVFVLCAAPRRDILLGKNLSYAPAAFILSLILLVALQILCPMRIDHALAMIPQFLTMFLLFCAMANLFSICVPYYVASGTLKAANPKFTTVLLQLIMFMVLFPILQGLTLLPIGVEAGLRAYGLASGVPVALLLTVSECVAVGFFYHASLGWLGTLLQSREQKILETVTNRAM